ncbi:MAG: sodium:calcium antiporter [Actinomycetota bacterium]
MVWGLLVASLVIILGGAELFTNGVEWVGKGFGLSEGAVGSVLAAIGTALPETLLPIVAIMSGHVGGDDIGIGAILGAPFMLTTLAMFALGVTVVVVSRKGKRSATLEHDPGVFVQDLRYFLVMYSLALFAGLIHVKAFSVFLAIGLVVAYGFYVRRHFASPGEDKLAAEAAGEVKRLYIRRLLHGEGSPIGFSLAQTILGLGVIVGGAQIFVHAIDDLATRLNVSHLVFALLVAPIATELPEALNSSVIWARRGKDVLALGNITGAMVFQATFPVTIGLLFTPWRLDQTAGVAAAIALVAAGVLYLTASLKGRLRGRLLLVQGVFYVGYVAYVVARG